MPRCLATVLLLVLSLPGVAHAQLHRDDFKRVLEANVGTQNFDPRDLSGIWLQLRPDDNFGTPAPLLTPAGAAAKAGHSVDNKPWFTCNPMGYPRLLNDDEPMELITLPDRILQLFQWEHRTRMLWADGRNLPSGDNLENLGPAWYGHSVGKWDGNTLVVNTVGLDDRAWLDDVGYPKSFHARIEETWKLIDSNTLEMQLTLYDPEYYTAPWISARKAYRRIPKDQITYFGWYGLYAGITEGICAPVNEVETFNKGFRDPSRAKP
jgi:hypothetical protein